MTSILDIGDLVIGQLDGFWVTALVLAPPTPDGTVTVVPCLSTCLDAVDVPAAGVVRVEVVTYRHLKTLWEVWDVVAAGTEHGDSLAVAFHTLYLRAPRDARNRLDAYAARYDEGVQDERPTPRRPLHQHRTTRHGQPRRVTSR